MATHPARPAPAITRTDLRACLTPADLFVLFRKLGYPAGKPVPLAVESDDPPGSLRDGVAARYSLAVIGGERPGDPRLDVTLFVLRLSERAGALYLARGAAQEWPRRFPGHHLFIFAVPGGAPGEFPRLILTNPRRVGEDAQVRFRLHKLIVERARLGKGSGKAAEASDVNGVYDEEKPV